MCAQGKNIPNVKRLEWMHFFFFFISAFGDYKVLTQSGTYIIFV